MKKLRLKCAAEMTDQRTDGWTNERKYQRTNGRTNGRTDSLIEMRGRIKKDTLFISFSIVFLDASNNSLLRVETGIKLHEKLNIINYKKYSI